VRRAEIQHAQTLESLGKKLDHAIDSFQSLDSSLNFPNANSTSKRDEGGNVAVKIGEKLEELDRQSRRATDAAFLVQCWTEVSQKGSLTELEDVRRMGGGEGKVKCAVLAKQLMQISRRLDPASWSEKANGVKKAVNGSKPIFNEMQYRYNTREVIEKFSETLEKDLLKEFDAHYRKQNWDQMKVRKSRDWKGEIILISAQ
jgi:exocyst complex component 5